MQGLSRVLAVVVAVLSVAFMGFAGVVSVGGPNWEAEARALEGYTFSRSEGESPVWSATRSAGRQELSTKSTLLPEVYVAAIKDRTSRAQEEVKRLTEDLPKLETQRQTYAAWQEADVPALEEYFELQRRRLSQVYEEIQATGRQQDAIAAEVNKLEDQVDSRRQDVFQLELQYRVLQADIARIQQNIKTVEEQIRLLEDELDKSQRRQQALEAQGL